MKRSRGEILGNAFVAALVVAAVFATAVSVTAAERGAAGGGVVERGWSDWEYSKSVVVKENSGATLTDYQVLLNLSGEDFPEGAKTDGSDLRFVDAGSGEELSYWVEKFDAANETGKVWVKVPEIPADGEAKFKMLFGNPSVESASNGSAVFEFFDDFEGTGLDASKWTTHIDDSDENISVEEGNLILHEKGDNDGVWLDTNKTFNTSTVAVGLRITGENVDQDARWGFTLTNIGHLIGNDGVYQGVPTLYDYKLGSISHLIGIGTYYPVTGEKLLSQSFERAWFVPVSGNLKSYYAGETLASTETHSYSTGYLEIYQDGGKDGGNFYVDYVFVRKYADPEPTITIEPGEEEPTVTVSTDEPEYSPGDRQTTTLRIANPTEESVTFQWFWVVPQYSVCVPVKSAEIPAGYDETLGFTYTIPDWGATTFGNVFYVQLLGGGAGGEVLDADAGCWIYNPSGEAISQTELAEQIKKTLQDFEATAPAATTSTTSTTSTSTATKKLPKGWPTDSQSTTGPEPPAGLAGGAVPQTLDYEVVISEVPAYEWHRGCGPTAAGMILGYWDGQGFDDLVSGDAATQTTAVNDAISSSGNYDDYCLPLDYYPAPILPDRSEPPVGDEHADDCVADFMKTSQSFHRNYYGWSWYSAVDDALLDYVQSVAPQYRATARNDHWGVFTWASFRAEIDANRPVELLVDTNGDGKTDHFVTAVGYGERGSTPMYACLNTWDEAIHWFEFAQMSAGQQWGIYGATIFSLEQNEAEAAVSISTDEFKYSPGETLTATIKIANPSEEDLTFQWFWAVPQFSICVPVLSFPVAAGYDETHDFNFTIPNWGATPFGNLFFVQLLDEDSGGEVWDLDAACWAYRPSAVAVGATPVEELDLANILAGGKDDANSRSHL
ncbi:MAG: hypothetical protein C4B55_02030 [Candidatus Methanophagaceae archaeon]|nr:MAG: hypothetical protein C4B55_02030 [Methanophagales archaeon]